MYYSDYSYCLRDFERRARQILSNLRWYHLWCVDLLYLLSEFPLSAAHYGPAPRPGQRRIDQFDFG